MSVEKAVETGLQKANTPYTLLLGECSFPSSGYALERLLANYNELEKASPIISTSETKFGQINHRLIKAPSEPV